MARLIECVPNFSEGSDMNIIRQITNEIEGVEGVQLLDVDPGKATNRTVVTFVGEPEAIVEAAFRAVKKASELIDMTNHHGEHPRFGATDVLPLIPVSGISMDETVDFARKLAQRIGEDLRIPVYCYENAAFSGGKRNLAKVREGEYEGLKEKLLKPEWKPDYGPSVFNPKTGSIAVGARDFLVAYNVNLNTTSVRRANAVAYDVREKGRVKRTGDPLSGKIEKDREGNPVYIPGSLKAVKAIGWYIKEYGIAQISINLTNISVTPLHIAFDEVCKKAEARGLRVTGSEIVGLVPLKTLLDAGRYFLKKQKRSAGVSDPELIKIAVKTLGLDELGPFNPKEKIIEYKLNSVSAPGLMGMTLSDFIDETASESPAPGGGSVSACIGAMGIALGTMVANLSSHKKGWDDRWEEFSNWAEKGKALKEELVKLVDEDTDAFNKIMDAFSLPKSSTAEKESRKKAIQIATLNAIEVPFKTMKTAFQGFELISEMVKKGNPNSISDAGVGALAIRSCIMGAWLNVKINAASYDDQKSLGNILKTGQKIVEETVVIETQILDDINKAVAAMSNPTHI
jgi:glutamate formiminotransferase/formiminotetrahydrofolate cyclodeaminase